MLKKVFIIAALTTLGAGYVLAQDPIAARKELMKATGAATGPVGRMMQGGEPFDLAKAQAALRQYQQTSTRGPTLFPDGSGSGDTRALPALFAEKDKVNAIFAKIGADATAALAAIKDEATFKSEMPKVLANCGACHTPYRRPQ